VRTLKELFIEIVESFIDEARVPNKELMTKLVQSGKVEFTDHADKELRNDNISRQDAITALTVSQAELSKSAQYGDTRYCFKKGPFRIIALVLPNLDNPQLVSIVSGYDIRKPDKNQQYRPSHFRGRGIAGPRPTGYKP
jgi:hypothetical protein